MKKCFLIGDSIRFGLGEGMEEYGYGYHLKNLMKDKAEVYAPDVNCMFAQNTLRFVHEWKLALNTGDDVDVVYWNNGLWDVQRLLGDEPLTPLEEYGKLLVRIYKRISVIFPKAKVIFALTTPVIEELTHPDGPFFNSDIDLYNQKAIEVLKPLGVEIDALNSVAKEVQKNHFLDAAHYKPEGARLLANHIAKIIKDLL